MLDEGKEEAVQSPPLAGGAWIEIARRSGFELCYTVAPLAGGVD